MDIPLGHATQTVHLVAVRLNGCNRIVRARMDRCYSHDVSKPSWIQLIGDSCQLRNFVGRGLFFAKPTANQTVKEDRFR